MKRGGLTGKKPGILLAFFLWGEDSSGCTMRRKGAPFHGLDFEKFFHR